MLVSKRCPKCKGALDLDLFSGTPKSFNIALVTLQVFLGSPVLEPGHFD